MSTVNFLKKYSLYTLLAAGFLFTSCDSDDVAPEEVHDHETITDVILTFTNNADANDVVTITAVDEDGVAGLDHGWEVEDNASIDLAAGATYTLTFKIENHLEEEDHLRIAEGDDGHEHGVDITEEIEEEGDEHQFFFEFTDGAFSDPTGNGNMDGNTTGDEAINYLDQDVNNNPIGLETSWTASTTLSTETGVFKARLMHQADGLKTSTSNVNVGDADFTVEFDLNIVAPQPH